MIFFFKYQIILRKATYTDSTRVLLSTVKNLRASAGWNHPLKLTGLCKHKAVLQATGGKVW